MKEKFNISEQEQRKLFKVPENYFKELPQQIQRRVERRPKNILHPIQWGVSLACIVIALFFFYPKDESTTTGLITISSQEAYDYLLQNSNYLDEEYLTDALVENDVTINAGAYYPNTTIEYPNTDILSNISINYLDLEDYELED